MKKIWKTLFNFLSGKKTSDQVLTSIPVTKEQKAEVLNGLKLVANSFGQQANPLFKPEFEAAVAINEILERNETLARSDAEEALRIYNSLKEIEHYDGSGWVDYLMRLGHYLRLNGYKIEADHGKYWMVTS